MAIWRRAWWRSTQRRLRRCSRQMSHAMSYCRARDDRSHPRVASLGGRVCIACVTDTRVSFSVHLFVRSAHTTIVTDRRQRPYLLRFVCELPPDRPREDCRSQRLSASHCSRRSTMCQPNQHATSPPEPRCTLEGGRSTRPCLGCAEHSHAPATKAWPKLTADWHEKARRPTLGLGMARLSSLTTRQTVASSHHRAQTLADWHGSAGPFVAGS